MSLGSRSLAKPTVNEQIRMGMCKEHCVICHASPAEYHHVLVGGHRMGHRFGYGLCKTHHRWVSLHARKFHAIHGSDQYLQDFQDRYLNLPIQQIPAGRRDARAQGAMAQAKTRRKPRRGSQCTASTKTFPRDYRAALIEPRN